MSKIIRSCAVCPALVVQFDMQGNAQRNLCTKANEFIGDVNIIPLWCPIPEPAEPLIGRIQALEADNETLSSLVFEVCKNLEIENGHWELPIELTKKLFAYHNSVIYALPTKRLAEALNSDKSNHDLKDGQSCEN